MVAERPWRCRAGAFVSLSRTAAGGWRGKGQQAGSSNRGKPRLALLLRRTIRRARAVSHWATALIQSRKGARRFVSVQPRAWAWWPRAPQWGRRLAGRGGSRRHLARRRGLSELGVVVAAGADSQGLVVGGALAPEGEVG